MVGISSKTIYAIAALQELGSIDSDKVLKIKEIAINANIPQNFLEQILLELKKQGLLTSIKGAHGGYKLAKPLKDITLKDVVIPEDLKRTISKEAEAEREKRAVIIKAEGEKIAAENLSKAANTLAQNKGALHLRTLQSINDISSDQSNTTIWMVPVEIMEAFSKFGGKK